MDSSFEIVLQHAIAPIVLISGVGLLLLCLINRYNQATSRTRGLIKEIREEKVKERKNNLQQQIDILLKRCHLLQASIALIVASTIFSSLIILIAVLVTIWPFSVDLLLKILLIDSFVCISIANILLFIEVTISLKAIRLELDYK